MKNNTIILLFTLILLEGCTSFDLQKPKKVVQYIKPRYATLMDTCIDKYINNGIKAEEAIKVCQADYGTR